ncbi:LOW QUALITY PROTEIN: Uncharacterized protein GBIM_05239, partial [Gryllus bimaculatus]
MVKNGQLAGMVAGRRPQHVDLWSWPQRSAQRHPAAVLGALLLALPFLSDVLGIESTGVACAQVQRRAASVAALPVCCAWPLEPCCGVSAGAKARCCRCYTSCLLCLVLRAPVWRVRRRRGVLLLALPFLSVVLGLELPCVAQRRSAAGAALPVCVLGLESPVLRVCRRRGTPPLCWARCFCRCPSCLLCLAFRVVLRRERRCKGALLQALHFLSVVLSLESHVWRMRRRRCLLLALPFLSVVLGLESPVWRVRQAQRHAACWRCPCLSVAAEHPAAVLAPAAARCLPARRQPLVDVGFVVAERRAVHSPAGLGACGGDERTAVGALFPPPAAAAAAGCCCSAALCKSRTLARQPDWASAGGARQGRGCGALPHNAKMHYNFANFQRDEGNIELATAHYKEALRLWPTYASAHNNLGTLMTATEDAEGHFLAAIRYSPNHVNAHYNLGQVYRKENRTLDAVRMLERCVRLDAGYTPAYLLLTKLYSALGLRREVGRLLRLVARLQPRSPDHRAELADWLQAQGEDFFCGLLFFILCVHSITESTVKFIFLICTDYVNLLFLFSFILHLIL